MRPPGRSAGGTARAAALCLGIAIGGFFDGILLHQILQWHHLLSGLEQGRGDLRFQLLADGLFHLSMYVLGLIGLWLALSAGRFPGKPLAGRRFGAFVFVGFGVWHVVDAIVSHWLLGIHRVRMDVEHPLVWDLAWVVMFGGVFLAIGYWLLRNQPRRSSGQGARSVPMLVALFGAVAGVIAARPPSLADELATIVVFAPGVTPARAMAAVAAVGGQYRWSDSADAVFALDLPTDADVSALYRSGALLVSRSAIAAGCANWIADEKSGA
jgi:uncharacterized membrane protein